MVYPLGEKRIIHLFKAGTKRRRFDHLFSRQNRIQMLGSKRSNPTAAIEWERKRIPPGPIKVKKGAV